MISLDWQGLTYGRLGTHGLVPPDITPGSPGDAGAGALVHDHVFDARARRHRLIRGLFHRDEVPPAGESVGRDEDLGIAVLQACRHRLSPIARKTRRVDRTD